MAGNRLTAWALLHAATRGAAQALHLGGGPGGSIGTLDVGAMADVCLWDVAVGPVAQRRDALARELHERLFAWVTLGDERNLAETWVGGVRRYIRDQRPTGPCA
jgi:guanine deaminase